MPTSESPDIETPTRRSWLSVLLRVPLRVKIAGANGLLVLAAALATLAVQGGGITRSQLVLVVALILLGSLLVNLVLVHVALLPLRDVESTASRVFRGDLDARVSPSPLADRDMVRIGGAINLLLERLTAERTRIRELAAQVIRAGDQERSRVARELHDSTAQTLAALALQATSALRLAHDPELREQLEFIRLHAVDALEEVRTLSHTVHPRVLDDLGIVAGLEALARRTREAHEVDATVRAIGDTTAIPRTLGSVFYTIAQEAVANALRHGAPRSIRIVLAAEGGTARLDVTDDGPGFDLEEARRRRADRGLFVMSERAALVDGTLDIETAPGRGTRISAAIPTTSLTPSSRHG